MAKKIKVTQEQVDAAVLAVKVARKVESDLERQLWHVRGADVAPVRAQLAVAKKAVETAEETWRDLSYCFRTQC